MSLSQMAALSGGGTFKRPYVEEINARTPYLPALYAQREDDDYRDKMHDISLDRLALSREELSDQKKAQKRANRLGYANIGLGAGLGVMSNWDEIKGGVSSMFPTSEAVSMAPSIFDTIPQEAVSAPFEMMQTPDWMSEFISPTIKNIGSGIWDAGKGIYDSLVGDSIDIDWDWSDAF